MPTFPPLFRVTSAACGEVTLYPNSKAAAQAAGALLAEDVCIISQSELRALGRHYGGVLGLVLEEAAARAALPDASPASATVQAALAFIAAHQLTAWTIRTMSYGEPELDIIAADFRRIYGGQTLPVLYGAWRAEEPGIVVTAYVTGEDGPRLVQAPTPRLDPNGREGELLPVEPDGTGY